MPTAISTAPEFGFTEALFAAVNEHFEQTAARSVPDGQIVATNYSDRFRARFGAEGASAQEVDAFEAETGLELPDDLRWLVQNTHDPGGAFFGWLKEPERIAESRDWIRNGIEFDLQHGTTWLKRWGEPPKEIDARIEIFRADFQSWPALVPVMGHRFLRIDPCNSGQPVYSIVQTDIIYYGANLASWLAMEFLRRPMSEREIKSLPTDSPWDAYAHNLGLLRDIDGVGERLAAETAVRLRKMLGKDLDS